MRVFFNFSNALYAIENISILLWIQDAWYQIWSQNADWFLEFLEDLNPFAETLNPTEDPYKLFIAYLVPIWIARKESLLKSLLISFLELLISETHHF